MAQNYFTVATPGILCTYQDLGRFGQGHLGLTTGGPADKSAFIWANKLVKNPINTTALELSFGGLKLIANASTTLTVTGAQAPLTINGCPKELWHSHRVNAGDTIEIGFATLGCRIYLAVAGGFLVAPQFGSVSTVLRESVGGVDGRAIAAKQLLAIAPEKRKTPLLRLSEKDIPTYSESLTLKVITGYQASLFDNYETTKFFANEYQVSSQCDRMGYRLNGAAINSSISKMYSEGICKGAIQIPPDGQPIVLANDRQTIGGYPKIGSVLSLDLNFLMQSNQGSKLSFEPISIHLAHNLLHLAHVKTNQTALVKVAD
ncbi:biotin-dependent carboxyltransferase [Colwellia sp. RSH04]|nr:biotin-dependent carboxyltransferase [Colwellia sp. RSH04]